MSASELFLALTDIDETYINTPRAAAVRGVRQRLLHKWLAVAACVCITVTMSLWVYAYDDQTALNIAFENELNKDVVTTITSAYNNDISYSIVYPSENQPCSIIMYSSGPDEYSKQTVYDYAELAQNADIIVVADVVGAYKEAENKTTFRLYAEVSVIETLKGNATNGDRLYVHENGYGRCDEDGKNLRIYTSCGGPLLEKGNRVLLFLSRETLTFKTSDGIELWDFVAYEVGKFFYDSDGKYHDSSLYAETVQTDTFRPYILEDYTPKTLGEIKCLIKE